MVVVVVVAGVVVAGGTVVGGSVVVACGAAVVVDGSLLSSALGPHAATVRATINTKAEASRGFMISGRGKRSIAWKPGTQTFSPAPIGEMPPPRGQRGGLVFSPASAGEMPRRGRGGRF